MFKTLDTREIFRDDVLAFRVDTVETPEGSKLSRKVIEYKESAAVVAFSDSNQILLIRHFRYPVGVFVWDIPGGMLQEGEKAPACALRELREETGYKAQNINYQLSNQFFPGTGIYDTNSSPFCGTWPYLFA